MESVEERNRVKVEEDRMVQLRNEKTRLEREIDILKIRYQDRQEAFDKQARDFSEKNRADIDKINRQLVENKAKEERLQKMQMEVSQLKAKFEQDIVRQNDLFLRKEVDLDRLIEETKLQKAELAKRLGSKETKHG